MYCQYEPNNRCGNEVAINFKFCIPHLNTPRGQQHMVEVARSGAMLVQSDIDRVIDERTRIPDKDARMTALEKMLEAFDRVIAFEQTTARLMRDLDPKDWRYQDRTGSEQIRSEVVLYERAMDRTARILKDISKMALDSKIVSLGKAQTELMVRILMSTINEIGLDVRQLDDARNILLNKMLQEANMGHRTKEHVVKELSGPPIIDADEA